MTLDISWTPRIEKIGKFTVTYLPESLVQLNKVLQTQHNELWKQVKDLDNESTFYRLNYLLHTQWIPVSTPVNKCCEVWLRILDAKRSGVYVAPGGLTSGKQ